jgi:hypothetical protein
MALWALCSSRQNVLDHAGFADAGSGYAPRRARAMSQNASCLFHFAGPRFVCGNQMNWLFTREVLTKALRRSVQFKLLGVTGRKKLITTDYYTSVTTV